MQETQAAVIGRKQKLIPTGGNWEGNREETIIELGLGGWKGCQETEVRPFCRNQTCKLHAGLILGTHSLSFQPAPSLSHSWRAGCVSKPHET